MVCVSGIDCISVLQGDHGTLYLLEQGNAIESVDVESVVHFLSSLDKPKVFVVDTPSITANIVQRFATVCKVNTVGRGKPFQNNKDKAAFMLNLNDFLSEERAHTVAKNVRKLPHEEKANLETFHRHECTRISRSKMYMSKSNTHLEIVRRIAAALGCTGTCVLYFSKVHAMGIYTFFRKFQKSLTFVDTKRVTRHNKCIEMERHGGGVGKLVDVTLRLLGKGAEWVLRLIASGASGVLRATGDGIVGVTRLSGDGVNTIARLIGEGFLEVRGMAVDTVTNTIGVIIEGTIGAAKLASNAVSGTKNTLVFIPLHILKGVLKHIGYKIVKDELPHVKVKNWLSQKIEETKQQGFDMLNHTMREKQKELRHLASKVDPGIKNIEKMRKLNKNKYKMTLGTSLI
jgi:hypothetical protein